MRTNERPAPGEHVPRVGICAAGEIWGGVEEFVLTLAQGLKTRGIYTRAILFYDAGLAHRLRDLAVPVDIVPSRSVHDIGQIRSVELLVRDQALNVLHVHGYRATVVGAAACARAKGVAMVRTEHGRLEFPSGWTELPRFARLAANVALERLASRCRVDEVAYVSEDTRRGAERWAGRGRVIYNGVDPRDIRRRAGRAPVGHDGFTMGIVGRLSAVKGHADLFRAVAELPPSVVLKVFGTGPDEMPLRHLASQLGVADRVRFMGFVSPVYRALAELDLLVMPSLHEGLPYVLLEAMSLGTPVVASRVGGLAEALEDGVTGVLVAPRNPQMLAHAIRALHLDPVRRRLIARRALATVARRFSARQMVGHYVDLYSVASTARRL